MDNGYRITFDQGDKGNDMSMIIHQATGRVTRYRRDKNVWVLDAIIVADIDSDFARKASTRTVS